MDRGRKFILWGLVFLAIAGAGAKRYSGRAPGGAEQKAPVRRGVVMARQTIPKWSVVTPQMVELQDTDVTQPNFPRDALSSLEAVTGRVARADIVPGRPIAAGQLLAQNEMGLSAQLPPGKRGMTIQVSDTTAVAGLIRPGDLIDVLGAFGKRPDGSVARADVILEGVQVVAVGKGLDQKPLSEAQPNNLVTLAVSPQEAEWLTLAQTRGSLNLVLRPLSDAQEAVVTQPGPPVAIHPAGTSVRRASLRHHTRVRAPHTHRTGPAGAGLPPLTPLDTRPALIYPPMVPVPSRPSRAGQGREGPAQPTVPAPPHTVEVIRGTQRETVLLRATEGKVPSNEGVKDQR